MKGIDILYDKERNNYHYIGEVLNCQACNKALENIAIIQRCMVSKK